MMKAANECGVLLDMLDQSGIGQHRIEVPLGRFEPPCIDRQDGSRHPYGDLIGFEDQDLPQFERCEIELAGLTNPQRERGPRGEFLGIDLDFFAIAIEFGGTDC